MQKVVELVRTELLVFVEIWCSFLEWGLQQVSKLLFLVELAFRRFGRCSVVKLSLISSLPDRFDSGFQIIFWVENSVLKKNI